MFEFRVAAWAWDARRPHEGRDADAWGDCMTMEERTVGSVVILAVMGDITLKRGSPTTIRDRVRGLVERRQTHLLLDLAGVAFVDSAGLGELVQAHSTTRNAGGSLAIYNVPRRLRDLLEMTRLTALLSIYDTEAEALASRGVGSA